MEMFGKSVLLAAAACVLTPMQAYGQSATDLVALRGLAPVTVLANTTEGKAALAANYTVTGGIQTGVMRQSTLLPFAEQQQQALRDASITSGNLEQLADGLGTTLGAAYVARAHYSDPHDFTSVSDSVTNLIAYALAVSGINSNSGKYFFANATTDGKNAVSTQVMEILKQNAGVTDVLGKAMGFPLEIQVQMRTGTRARFKLNQASWPSSVRTTSMWWPAIRYTTVAQLWT